MAILRIFSSVCVLLFVFVLGCGREGEEPSVPASAVGTVNTVPEDTASAVGTVPETDPPLTVRQITLGQEATGNKSLRNTAGIIVTSSPDIVTVTIRTHWQGRVFAHSLYVAYNPANLKFIDCRSGGFLGGDTVFRVLPVEADEGAADLTFTELQKSIYREVIMVSESRSGWDKPGITGDGDLVVLRFGVVERGTTELLFAEPLLFEKDANKSPVSKDMGVPQYVQFSP